MASTHATGVDLDDEVGKPYPKPTYKNATHVIFDLDGIILDTEPIYDDCFRATAEHFGKKLPDEVLLKTKGRQPNDCFNTIIDGLKLKCKTEEFGKHFETMAKDKCLKAKLMPGIERIAKHLYFHQVPLAVATSNEKPWFDMLAKNHFLFFTLIHHVVCGGSDPEVKHGKPAPDIFLVAASRFKDKPSPSKCLVFEDSHNGVLAAVAAGMQVVMLPEKITPPEQRKGATQVLRHLYRFRPEAYGWPEFKDDPLDGTEWDSSDEEEPFKWPPV